MQLSNLTAISPIDGRYRNQLEFLDEYFSEFALIKGRVRIEILYLLFLNKKKFLKLNVSTKKALNNTLINFSLADAETVKQTEKITNHDVKAVEYFVKNILEKNEDKDNVEWVHFGLTSQDINNTAIPSLLQQFCYAQYLPSIVNLTNALHSLALQNSNISMLAKTHGQAASPTNLGKEIMVFVDRLQNQIKLLAQVPFSAKFGGATGNFNAHNVAFPKFNWINFANEFVEKELMLERQQFTTQIEHYDNLAAFLQAVERINTILLDFCRDIWSYISLNYFTQKTKIGEVGSSAMPHKVNPIDFENAEGNLGIANALFIHLAQKLPVSRLQRDLTDSTVLRNIGVPFAHTILSIKSIEKGLAKLVTNTNAIKADLDNNWAVVAEAIQTILRREKYPNAYEVLKDFSRGNFEVNKASVHLFIDGLKVNAKVKKELKAITPHNYVGIVPKY